MIATLTVEGFGLTPDAAVEDLIDRVVRHEGWETRRHDADVRRGFNPYSEHPVMGYIATTTLRKERT